MLNIAADARCCAQLQLEVQGMARTNAVGGMIQVAMNGDRARTEHPGLPVTIDEFVLDAMECARAGATAFHIHPLDDGGHESLDGGVVNAAVDRIKRATSMPVGVTTGAWIEPDLHRRLEMIASWSSPDYTSVNVGEEGFDEVMRCLVQQGVGIEAGVSNLEDVSRLASSGMAHHALRILVEPYGADLGGSEAEALAYVGKLHQSLDAAGITAPRLQHSDGSFTWVVLADALEQGWDTRIGLEDTLYLPDDSLAPGNPALVAHAARIRRDGTGRAEP